MFLQVYFQDEAPQLGCGRRIVYVEKEGRKWVTIRDPFTHASKKLARDVWQRLARKATPAKVKRAIIRRTAKEHGREKTDATKAMLGAAS